MLGHWLSMQEALGLISSTEKQKKNKQMAHNIVFYVKSFHRTIKGIQIHKTYFKEGVVEMAQLLRALPGDLGSISSTTRWLTTLNSTPRDLLPNSVFHRH